VAGTPGPIKDIGYEGSQLVIELEEDHGVTTIKLLRGGSRKRSLNVGSAETKVSMDVTGSNSVVSGISLTPGEYELIAVDNNGNEVASTTLNHNPRAEVVDVVFKPETPKPSDYEHGDGIDMEEIPKVYATIENSGNAPVYIFMVKVDNPQDPHDLPANYIDPVDRNRVQKLLPPGERVEVLIGNTFDSLSLMNFSQAEVQGEHDITENLVITINNNAGNYRSPGEKVFKNYEVVFRHHGMFKTVDRGGTGTDPYWLVENTEVESISETDKRARG
jgi:hypothetical protein